MRSSTSRSIVVLLSLLSASLTTTVVVVEGFSSVVAPGGSSNSGFGSDQSRSASSSLSSPSSSSSVSSLPKTKKSPISSSRTRSSSSPSSIAKEIESDTDWLEFLYDDPTSTTTTSSSSTNMSLSMHKSNNKKNAKEQQAAKIKLVWFKSPTCKSCKRFTLDWKRKIIPMVSSSTTENKNELQLATFNVHHRGNQNLYKKQLQIKALPTVHLYHKGQLLEEILIGNPREFHKLEETLSHYLNLSSSSLIEKANSSSYSNEDEYDDDHFATELDL